jgi:hypothetical protein
MDFFGPSIFKLPRFLKWRYLGLFKLPIWPIRLVFSISGDGFGE